MPDDLVQRFEGLIRRYGRGIETEVDERLAVMQYAIELVTFAGNRGTAQQEVEKKKADDSKYKWGTQVTFKDSICNAKKPDNTPRFPKECELLTAMLAKERPEPEIECTYLQVRESRPVRLTP